MDRSAGGIGVPAEDIDHLQEAPPLWWVCFEVDDADTAAERVVAAGGALVQEPEEFGYGELVFAAGPDGERFAMMGPSSEDWTEEDDEHPDEDGGRS
jgi:predicted enzyme related to lactoylglutathione lyase